MTDEKSTTKAGKAKKGGKEGEDMTVVVPPSKNNKQSNTTPSADADGDVAMDESEKTEELEVKVDPVTQAIAGMCIQSFSFIAILFTLPSLGVNVISLTQGAR